MTRGSAPSPHVEINTLFRPSVVHVCQAWVMSGNSVGDSWSELATPDFVAFGLLRYSDE